MIQINSMPRNDYHSTYYYADEFSVKDLNVRKKRKNGKRTMTMPPASAAAAENVVEGEMEGKVVA
jgi:hypothetical protein